MLIDCREFFTKELSRTNFRRHDNREIASITSFVTKFSDENQPPIERTTRPNTDGPWRSVNTDEGHRSRARKSGMTLRYRNLISFDEPSCVIQLAALIVLLIWDEEDSWENKNFFVDLLKILLQRFETNWKEKLFQLVLNKKSLFRYLPCNRIGWFGRKSQVNSQISHGIISKKSSIRLSSWAAAKG